MTPAASLALAAVLWVFCLPARADERDRESLRDLDGVRVAVEDLSLALPVKGISAEQLKQVTEMKLRQARIEVLNQGEYPVGDPYLRVRVSTSPKDGDFAAYEVEVDFVQIVFLRRNPTATFNRAETWKASGRIGIARVAQLAEKIRQALSDQMDQFIVAYRSVNP